MFGDTSPDIKTNKAIDYPRSCLGELGIFHINARKRAGRPKIVDRFHSFEMFFIFSPRERSPTSNVVAGTANIVIIANIFLRSLKKKLV